MIKEIEVGGVRHSIQAENTIKVTWAELKALRDEAKLNAGTFYRITDYVTTTTQSQTKSANHPFDVIVLALSENTLCEDAKAALHEGDTYFADSDLGAWELKYCLDNDKTRFEWADETNGKGVIYRMVDENRNDCPYDFKNVTFLDTYTFNVYFGEKDASVARVCRVAYNTIHGCGGSIEKVIFHVPSTGKCLNNSVGAKSSGVFFGSLEGNTIEQNCSFQITKSNYNSIGRDCYNIIIEAFGGSVIKSYNSRLIVKSYNSVVEENFNDGQDVIEISKSNTTYTKAVQYDEKFYDDGSGQLVPIKHPDLSTQPSILPYKFMGQYVYEQLIPHDGDPYHKYNTFLSPQDLAVQNPMFLEAQCIMSDGVCPCSIVNSGGVEIEAKAIGERNGIKYIRVVYTSMPEEDGYYGYNNIGGGNIEDFSNAVVIRLAGNYSSGRYSVYFIGVEAERINDTTYVYKNLSSVSKDDAPAILIEHPSGNVTQPTSVKIYHDGVELDSAKVEIRNDGLITFKTPLPIYTYNTVEAIINI